MNDSPCHCSRRRSQSGRPQRCRSRRLVRTLRSPAIDAADIYLQSSRLQSWVLRMASSRMRNFPIDQALASGPSPVKRPLSDLDELQLPPWTAASARAITGGRTRGGPRRQRADDEAPLRAARPDREHRRRGQSRAATSGRRRGAAYHTTCEPIVTASSRCRTHST